MQKYWALFIFVSVILFVGYCIVDPFLKGLSTLQHFNIHFVVGIFFGLIFLLGFLFLRGRRLNEPLVLLGTVLWSHFPDIRFAFRHRPHDPWEVIFFFHTLVDEAYFLFWVFLGLDVVLGLIYVRISRTVKITG